MMPEARRQSIARIQDGVNLEPYSGQVVMELDYVYFRDTFDLVRRNTQKAHEAGIIGLGTDMGGTYTVSSADCTRKSRITSNSESLHWIS